ncbi:hypothetical protein SAMN04487846_0857 [Microbacterium sp. cf046]|uniref:DUF6790 family protein n=1 Tax=Microbacterium sp. cf046 TaxID=1761803 RepID=UPI0008EF9577|nr:DUF6790 family protein [Microbacterium sp. cf046]SFR93795.1 hypothetical protein SAMN04487846_0857 [Microbacterium sp. cf046]
MYFVFVVFTTVLAPLVSGVIAGSMTEWAGGALHVFGVWWVFWGIGVRLLAAGVSQILRPQFTSKEILHIDAPEAAQIVQELGFMNLSIGLAAVISVFVPEWAPAIGLAGGGFLLLAGLRHLPKKDKSAKEWVACLTDLLVGVVGVAFAVGSLLGAA